MPATPVLLSEVPTTPASPERGALSPDWPYTPVPKCDDPATPVNSDDVPAVPAGPRLGPKSEHTPYTPAEARTIVSRLEAEDSGNGSVKLCANPSTPTCPPPFTPA